MLLSSYLLNTPRLYILYLRGPADLQLHAPLRTKPTPTPKTVNASPWPTRLPFSGASHSFTLNPRLPPGPGRPHVCLFA
ncbi:hypothetical protein QL093DRAFT_1234185 [Fusarium oxysporum]|nr:hypothetical protein QL093DRAFT_1234185 [Fusarium oxysporum]